MCAKRRDIPAGSVWRQEKLDTVAIYEVIASGEDIVEVAVRTAPGLAPGTRLRLSRASVDAMELIAERDRPR
jgi:hypothetical protein